jgi:hypothetical protein
MILCVINNCVNLSSHLRYHQNQSEPIYSDFSSIQLMAPSLFHKFHLLLNLIRLFYLSRLSIYCILKNLLTFFFTLVGKLPGEITFSEYVY